MNGWRSSLLGETLSWGRGKAGWRDAEKYEQEVTVLAQYSVTIIQITSQHPGLDLDEKGRSEITHQKKEWSPTKGDPGAKTSQGLFSAVYSKYGLGLVSVCKLLSLCDKISVEMRMFRDFCSNFTGWFYICWNLIIRNMGLYSVFFSISFL